MAHKAHHGTVTSITAHGDKHVEVEVSHGRRKPLTKTQKAEAEKYGNIGPSNMYDSRPRSRVIVPKEHASDYHMGQRVGVGMAPSDEGDEGDEADDGDQEEAMEDYHATMRGLTRHQLGKSGGKKK